MAWLVLGKVGDEEHQEEDGEVGVRITFVFCNYCLRFALTIKTKRIDPIVSLIIFVLYNVWW